MAESQKTKDIKAKIKKIDKKISKLNAASSKLNAVDISADSRNPEMASLFIKGNKYDSMENDEETTVESILKVYKNRRSEMIQDINSEIQKLNLKKSIAEIELAASELADVVST